MESNAEDKGKGPSQIAVELSPMLYSSGNQVASKQVTANDNSIEPNAENNGKSPYHTAVELGTMMHPLSSKQVATKQVTSNDIQELLTRYPMPNHWRTPSPSTVTGFLSLPIFGVMCFLSFGTLNLEGVWLSTVLDRESDERLRNRTVRGFTERLNYLLVSAGLMLATVAVFVTTVPPVPWDLDYAQRINYLLLKASLHLLLACILCTAIILHVFSTLPPALEVLLSSRLAVYFFLFMLSPPLVTFFFGVFAFFLVIASGLSVVLTGATILWALVMVVFMHLHRRTTKDARHHL